MPIAGDASAEKTPAVPVIRGAVSTVDRQKIMRTEFLNILLAAATMSGSELAAATIRLTPVADTSLYAGAADNNMGGQEAIAVGGTATGVTFRGLLKFDVADNLPAGAVIQSVSLQLTVVKSSTTGVPSTFTVHRVLKNWGEGDKGLGITGIGALAGDGEATWRARLHPAILWGAAGGEPGVDFASAASGATSEPVQSSGAADFASTPDLIADVRHWLAEPGDNFGWLLQSESEATLFTSRRFGSSEGAEPPLLIIDAIVPPHIGLTSIANGLFTLQFDGEAGKSYVVERRTQADSGEWTIVTNVPPLEISGPVSVTDPLRSGNQFYRVGELQSPGGRSGN